MNGYQYILARQIAWAKNRDLSLVASKITRGQVAYTATLEENLFEPLLPEVRTAFESGDGGELGSPGWPAKMQAVHSSSALAVNVFQYWLIKGQVPVIAAACGLCRPHPQAIYDLRFEEKQPIDDSFTKHPNVDVVIHNHTPGGKIQCFAIESKFTEAYGMHRDTGLKEKYLALGDIWCDIPHVRNLAESISPMDREFAHMHPAQLIKHILGLKRKFGRDGFRLLYLWYDVLGAEGKCHRDEVARFAAAACVDGIMFHSLTYQELIVRLAEKQRSCHPEYIRYLTSRYL